MEGGEFKPHPLFLGIFRPRGYGCPAQSWKTRQWPDFVPAWPVLAPDTRSPTLIPKPVGHFGRPVKNPAGPARGGNFVARFCPQCLPANGGNFSQRFSLESQGICRVQFPLGENIRRVCFFWCVENTEPHVNFIGVNAAVEPITLWVHT
jgi:hypothetical protein